MRIENDVWHAELCPEFGGAMLALAHRGKNVLRPAPGTAAVRQDPRQAAHYPCVPWFNRLYGGFDFQGGFWPLDPIIDEVAALHGEGWVNAWRIVAHLRDRARLELRHAGARAGRFPFAFAATQEFALTQSAFALQIAIRNEHSAPAPFGLGLHPFFVRAPGTKLRFAASGMTAALPCAPERADAKVQEWCFDRASALPDQTIDHCFSNFGGEVAITGGEVTIRLKSAAPFLHVYAPSGEDFFCLEPVTHAPGRFGEIVLNPGAVLSLNMELSVELG